MSFWTGSPESTPIQTECMHGELGPNPHEDSLTSYTCYMMPCELSDRSARIDSKPDTSACTGSLVRIHMRIPSRATRAT